MCAAAGAERKKRMIGTGFNKPFSGKQDRLEGAHKPWSGPEGGKCRRPIGNDRVNAQNARARDAGMTYMEYTSLEAEGGAILGLTLIARKCEQMFRPDDTGEEFYRQAYKSCMDGVNQMRMQKFKLDRFEQKEAQRGGH